MYQPRPRHILQSALTIAQKAEAAAQKKAAEDSKRAAEEDKQWSKGGKSNAKKYVGVEVFHLKMVES